VAGTVVSVGWRTVRIQTRDDMHVIVPNGKLAQATLVNRSRPRRPVSFVVDVGVQYSVDLDRVVEITTAVAEQVQAHHPSAAEHFRPRVMCAQFGASSVDLKVWLRCIEWQAHFGLQDAFIRALHRRYKVEGIDFAFPSRSLYVSNPLPIQVTSEDEVIDGRDG
jgi:small-conductance mechanosensitive channel